MRYITYTFLALTMFLGLVSCSDHESEFDLNECVKVKVVNVDESSAVIDVLLLPPLYTQAYQDSVSPQLIYDTADVDLRSSVGKQADPSERIEEDGKLWYRYNLSALTFNSTYTFAVQIPSVFLGNGKDSLKIGIFGSNDNGHPNRIFPENNVFSLTKLDISPVDLGLSVLWANTDLGVNAGDIYSQVLYRWSVNKLTGLPPYKNISGTDEDLATSVLGDGWRTPTAAEMQELIDNCTWSDMYWYRGEDKSDIITYCKHIAGKGKYADAYIELFPHRYRNEENYIGTYWTASVAEENLTSNTFTVNCLFFTQHAQEIVDMPYFSTPAYFIRPVKDR